MGPKCLIDTNVISHLFADKLPEKGKKFVLSITNNEFIISVIVEIEALTYHNIPDKMSLIEELVSMATILQLDSLVIKKSIENKTKTQETKTWRCYYCSNCNSS